MNREALENALLQTHADDDSAELVRLYTLAAEDAETHQDIDAACFYFTHAFVFALESGDRAAPGLNLCLAKHGRAHRLVF